MSDSTFKPMKVARPLKDQDNYYPWVVSMGRILRICRLASVVTGTETTAPPTATEEWQTKCDKALITIIANCEGEAQTLVEVCETPTDAWKILKEHYGGRTRTHLSALLFNIMALRFDDRKTTITDHITAFEGKWNLLRLNTASATAGTDSLAAGIKNFANTDAWKATMLLATLPGSAVYQNIIDNINASTTDLTYATIVLRLKNTVRMS